MTEEFISKVLENGLTHLYYSWNSDTLHFRTWMFFNVLSLQIVAPYLRSWKGMSKMFPVVIVRPRATTCGTVKKCVHEFVYTHLVHSWYTSHAWTEQLKHEEIISRLLMDGLTRMYGRHNYVLRWITERYNCYVWARVKFVIDHCIYFLNSRSLKEPR